MIMPKPIALSPGGFDPCFGESEDLVAVNLTVDTRGEPPELLVKLLDALPGVDWIELTDAAENAAGSGEPVQPHQFRLHTDGDSTKVLAEALRVMHEKGCEVRDVGISKPSLEDVFIKLTGKALR